MTRPNAVLLDEADHVATVLRAVQPGETVLASSPAGERRVISKDTIPIFHKIAMAALSTGSDILKFGEPIGVLTADVEAGALVHLHNLRSKRARSS
ncbi:MAG: UxaA family hydrolase [Geminicoccaceae bacterium]